LYKLKVKDVNGWGIWREWKRMVRRVFEAHPGGRRKTVRPRKRWVEIIEEDLRLMKVKRWTKKATEREVKVKQVKQSSYTPWRRLEGEEV
jgi:uncharacterized protein (DUF2461 family)